MSSIMNESQIAEKSILQTEDSAFTDIRVQKKRLIELYLAMPM